MEREISLEQGFTTVQLENKTSEKKVFKKEVKSSFIQLHFSVAKKGKLNYGPFYSHNLKEAKSLLLYNPGKDLPINLALQPGAKYLIFIVAIETFHSFFSQVANLIHFLDDKNKNRKYYMEDDISPSQKVVINQLFSDQMHDDIQKLYFKAKAYELLSLYFNKKEGDDQSCPFLNDEENVEKIKKAKRIIIENMAEPPSLQELADQINLSLPKLKEGFKHIYGESVFNFLLDYKLEYARQKLLSNKYNVSEISHEIGYSTASHFISAFKKKYGTTPKQYLMSAS